MSGGQKWLHIFITILPIIFAVNVKSPVTIVTTPNTLYLEDINYIAVVSSSRIREIHIKTVLPNIPTAVNEETEYGILHLPGGWFKAKIPYCLSFVPPDDQIIDATLNFAIEYSRTSFGLTRLSQSVRIGQRPRIILSETDKPLYRPGETVRARFLMLGTRLTLPTESELELPERKLIIYNASESSLQILTQLDKTRLQRVIYDEISITDAAGSRVKRWLNATPYQAATLKYSLLPNAPVGTWKITAQARGKQEVINFDVKNYVLPRFTVTITAPTDLSIDSNFTRFSVCAAYTDGLPLPGSVRASLCACPRPYTTQTNSEPDSELIIEQAKCPRDPNAYYYYGAQRPCISVSGTFAANGCASFNVSTSGLQLRNETYQPYNLATLVCAEVAEQDTNSKVSKCTYGSDVSYQSTQLVLTFPGVYRTGLPLVGLVQLISPKVSNLKGSEIQITLSKQPGCFHFIRSIGRSSDKLFTTKVRTNGTGFAKVFIPPIDSNQSISIEAVYDEKKRVSASLSKSDGSSKSSKITIIPFPPVTEDGKIRGYGSLQHWESNSNITLQVGLDGRPERISCPGEVILKLIANVPLWSKTIHLETVVRGKTLYTIFPPGTDADVCKDRDDELGHYRCQHPQTNRIYCLQGWQGNDCLQPVCRSNCNPKGGSCGQPNTCVCYDGWKGVNCERCIRQPGCVHGKCVDGNDCVCYPGWEGYNCDQEVKECVKIPATKRPKKSKRNNQRRFTRNPRRTIHERTVKFSVDGRWGPQAKVVIYFFLEGTKPSDVIATTFTLDNLVNCTSPSIAVESQSKRPGLNLDRSRARPGQKVSMTLIPKGDLCNPNPAINTTDGQLTDQVCFARISDIALDNFGAAASLLSVESYATKMAVFENEGQYRPLEPNNIEDAFLAAGLLISSNIRLRTPTEIRPFCFFALRGPVILETTTANSEKSTPAKPRLRDFFPEVWLFDAFPLRRLRRSSLNNPVLGVRESLTVPDTITTWRASAFCTTCSSGLWIPPTQLLTVSLPFFIQLTLPKQLKRYEILYLPISVFVTRDNQRSTSGTKNQCYGIELVAKLNATEWSPVGVGNFSACVCDGEKKTFYLGIQPQMIGKLNITVEATASNNSTLCSDRTGQSNGSAMQAEVLKDAVRQQIDVQPEGIPKETAYGDILCLTLEQKTAVRDFNLSTPDNIIPNSLQVYLSYSDEVLGPALLHLDGLVSLPTGCGEQNMLLVTPNVYVLSYFQAVPGLNSEQTNRLIQQARSNIQIGYQKQLRYQRDDGSFSAFGNSDKEGSTWLTALVLRVFASAYKIDTSLVNTYSQISNQTIGFLKQVQNSTGCFFEKGRVLHTPMQGGLGSGSLENKDVLLTTYVISAILKAKVALEDTALATSTALVANGFRCLQEAIGNTLDSPTGLQSLSTYGLAQLAYANTLYQSNSSTTSILRQELVRRRQTSPDSGSAALTFWTGSDSPQTGSGAETTALDVETTGYAYLTLAMLNATNSELLPIIRWLSTKQTSSGGFYSTQDTALALEAISDFAKRLGLANNTASSGSLLINSRLEPASFEINDVLTEDKRRTANQILAPYFDPTQVKMSMWTLSTNVSAVGCIAVQTALRYNVPSPNSTVGAFFTIQLTVNQPKPPPTDACKSAQLDVCLSLPIDRARQSETGMLLITVNMVSGWLSRQDEITKQIDTNRESLRRTEFAEDGTVYLYFDGFTKTEASDNQGTTDLKRCARVPLFQSIFVDKPKSAAITGVDYYSPERTVSTSYSLDSCSGAAQI